ncbi:hypothetical protein VTO42DRAFT_3716 [Malbranchea cinnamomea]
MMSLMGPGLFEQALHDSQAIEIHMDEVRFVNFAQTSIRCVGTARLNGCTAVALASPLGAILAHIPPHPNRDCNDPYAGDRHVEGKMKEFISLYCQHQDFFPAGMTTWVVSPMYQGKIALPDHRDIIERTLQEAGLASGDSTYIVVRSTRPRGPGKGTVFIDARKVGPLIYVEDRCINF